MTLVSAQINQSLFQLSDPGKVYINPSFETNLQTLVNGIKEEKKIFLFSGKQGCGKKTLVQKAIYELKNKALLVNIKQENLDYEKLIDYTGKCLENGFSSSAPLEEKLTRIKELLKKKSIQHVVVLFDQSLEFKRTVIENGLLLVNSTLSESCSFHLFITGLPGLTDQLKQSGFPASILRDSCSFQIEQLSENNTCSYIKFHLQHLEDQGDKIFSKDAVNQILKYSRGLPGLINRLCSLGLLTANLEEKSSVSLEMIDEVLENSLFLGNEFDYTPSTQDNSFSVDEIMDDNLTFNNAVSPKSTPPAQPKPSEHKKPVVKSKQQSLAQNEHPNKNTPVEQRIVSTDSTALTHKDNIKPKPKELDLDKLINSARVEKKEAKHITKHKPKKKHASSRKSQRKKRVSSKKSPLFSAFSMGVIFSTLICTGLYFFLFKNQGNSVSQVAISDSDSDLLSSKNEHPQQQLEARLNYLEQQLKKQRTMVSENNTAEISEQNTIDYVSKLPTTAAGDTKIEQSKINTQYTKINRSTESTDPQEKNVEEIEELLLLAKQQLANKKLMTPVNDSAWSTYNKVLTLAPDNQEANSGINEIRDTYIVWARHEIKKGNPKHATFLFKKALEISPGDAEILSAIITLEGKKPTNTRKNGAFSKNNLFKLLDTPKGIEKLLAIAELQISRKNLTSPDRNSAFTIYKFILNRFPRHTSAQKGIKKIKETYVVWAKHEIAQGNYLLAESLYSKALKVAPADPEITSNLDQLRSTINQFSR